jgi:hypothetical protein
VAGAVALLLLVGMELLLLAVTAVLERHLQFLEAALPMLAVGAVAVKLVVRLEQVDREAVALEA